MARLTKPHKKTRTKKENERPIQYTHGHDPCDITFSNGGLCDDLLCCLLYSIMELTNKKELSEQIQEDIITNLSWFSQEYDLNKQQENEIADTLCEVVVKNFERIS